MSIILLPEETVDQAMTRRIMMHEFLMTGGVQTGYNDKGQMTYSDPITVADYPVCPWHGEDCLAWNEIVAGRGHWTRMEAELAEAEAELAVAIEEKDEESAFGMIPNVNRLRDKLAMRPRDALALRQRTPEQIEAEHAEAIRRRVKRTRDLDEVARAAGRIADKFTQSVNAHPSTTGRVYAAAGPKTGGNPWDRKTTIVDEKTGEVFDRPVRHRDHHTPMFKVEDDSRDDAARAFGGEAVPDHIEIDGDEGEEGEEN